ncbi:TAXI family TRAP transporter solute-binding subunit [Futiania mangrovi]|uniref:TAXI family TRAP transporter solute-binding subunit n=1 Tax=Futiania mangrovi TaxID=2959716 RepID=A0A9J6PCT3_9PROT|nr:TAXI family TRAP transporter solute-binding subunit [Futiania mangrovii]MCP1337165.1 TAXI family TRAP transporter solute-binding subunit [Futiania mangrovii]
MRLVTWIRAGAMAAGLVAIATAAPAQNASVDLISGPFGTGSYVLANALEQISKAKATDVQINSTETPGLVFNANKLNKEPDAKKNTIMAFTAGINYLATNGEPPFKETLPSAMLIANYNLGVVWLATFDETLKTPQDLVGKRIALGRPPQILWTIEPRLIIRHGWGLEDKIDIETLGTKEAADALLNGHVDAAIIGGYVDPGTGKFLPSPQTVELLASGRTLHHIPWGEKAVADTIAAGVSISPITVKPGSVDGLDIPVPAFFDAVAWMAYPELDEELAYKVTKTIIDNVGSFAEYHSLGKLMSAEALTSGWSADRIHPGALRAYREAGLVK